jgi:hypothetical protein
MGASAPRPTSGNASTDVSNRDFDYYRNVLNNQKQNVANVPQVQAAQSTAQTPPNRPGASLPGFGGQQQGQGPQQGAYQAYMNRFGGDPSMGNRMGWRPGEGPSDVPSGVDPYAKLGKWPRGEGPTNAPTNAPQRPGIVMGNGYSRRS